MAAAGEILLNAFFQVLFDRLASRNLLSFVRQLQGGVDSELKKWEKKLKMIQAVLCDAEEKQLTNEAVKMWLDELQDLSYDAEDILDEFSTQALESKLMAQNQDSSGQVLSFIQASLNPNAIMFNYSMGSKIKDITSRLEQLCQERIELGLQQLTGEASSTAAAAAARQRPPSSSVPTEREVFGREEDKAKILGMVLADAPSDRANFVVIPIVGMGGIGKTTLAREVYNDKAVGGSEFDVKAWVCVSDVFDVLGISKALLESITRRPCLLNSLNEVQVELKVAVDKKRFLLVLDDVWNEEYSLWVDLKAPFLAAAPNSKMIVTTRNPNVASTMGPIEHYNLKSLSDDDCWSIFIKHAFESRDLNANQISESFRKKVVAKCGGLALAAKTLGGLLRTTRHDAWDDILGSKIWDLPRQSGVLPVLRLSYHHLPSHLKICFAFCAIFPKDYEFTEKELTFLWMAGGIIRQSRNNEQLEDLGSKCFGDLVSRSIFQQTTISDSSKFVMHDLIHDLAELVSGGTIFRLEKSPNLSSSRFERVRHSSYAGGLYDGKNKFEVFYEIEHLRTFLPLRLRIHGTFYITRTVLSDLLPKFKKLRMLSLEGYCIGELPIPFEDLRLLRFLNLADTDIRSLPESTCKLLNLEILILRNCSRLIKLPPKMRNLINLRHLDIRGATLLKEMPFGMKELKKLQILYNFIVGKGETASGLEDLGSLNFLCDELCIVGLENVNNPQNAREAALCEKHNLEALTLDWGSQFDNSRDAVVEEHVLEILQPHKRIKKVAIRNYRGARFPHWIGDPLFSKIEFLELENCDNCVSLPSLGRLSSLKHLAVKGLKKLKRIGSEVYGEGLSVPFPSLEVLSFENLPEWEYWDTNIRGNVLVEMFPRLHKLSIVECPKLSGELPELLPSLETLVVIKCEKLVVPLSRYPMLCRLEVDECKELVCRTPIDFKLIKSMTISNSSLEMNGRKGMLYDGPAGSSLPKPMTTTNVLEFGKLLKPGFQIFETLVIGNSEHLKSWRQHGDFPKKYMVTDHGFKKPVRGLNMLASPEEVSIEESCVRLVLFPEINFFPRNLRSLLINNSTALKSLPEEMMENNSQLERLYIKDCDSLTFIARRRLPASLKRLEIENCEKLQRLFDDEEDASSSSSPASSSSPVMLQHLSIENCPELTSLSSGAQFLEALEELVILHCRKLESIPDGLPNLKCLQRISIRGCPSLVSFPERGLPHTISGVFIASCVKLEALPNNLHKLNSLRGLSMHTCPNLVSFPEEGFPTNLRLLTIGYFKMYKTLVQWGLHRLTSLRKLCIIGCDDEAECFPDEEIVNLSHSSVLLDIQKFDISVFDGFSEPHLSSIFVDRELPESHIISRGYDRWKIHIRSRVRGVDSLIKNLLYYVLAVAVSEVTCLYLFASDLRTPTFARDLEKHLKTLSKLDKLQDALAPTPYSPQRKTYAFQKVTTSISKMLGQDASCSATQLENSWPHYPWKIHIRSRVRGVDSLIKGEEVVSFNPELEYGNLVQAHTPGHLVSEPELYAVFSTQ
ncbi:putative disease resistance RPP13-like protein 1 [Citrus sinensis]|uniref:Disease resistance RPP13-like protein 1 n=1 Tax=Citrus sinensis TaxID=2711 RepID=A0ACB8MAN7_CITSI|nr:putative disease resistance RPP13-like protein 1 [Citrus sinensis]